MKREIKVNIYKGEDMVKVFGRVIRNNEDEILFDNGLVYCLLDKNNGTVTINDTEYDFHDWKLF